MHVWVKTSSTLQAVSENADLSLKVRTSESHDVSVGHIRSVFNSELQSRAKRYVGGLREAEVWIDSAQRDVEVTWRNEK